MIGTIRKHSKGLWFIVITVTIITFVFWTGKSSNPREDAANMNLGTVDGVPVTRDAYVEAAREGWLRHFITYGPNSRMNFDEQQEAYDRLFWIKKLKDYNIQVDDAAVYQTANDIFRTGGITLDKFTQMIAQHATIADFERYLRNSLGIQQLISVIALSSDLVTSQEAQTLYVQEHQELATEAVFFQATNYLSRVAAPTPEAIEQFYQSHLPDYRLNDRVQISYVKFDPTNFMAEADKQIAQITNLNALVDEIYQQRGSNYHHEAKTPEEAKKKIVEESRLDMARAAAHKKAEEFADQLYNIQPMRPENLVALAKTNDLAVHTTAPFDEQKGLEDMEGGHNLAQIAFALTPAEPFAEQPIYTGEAFYVIALDQKIPSEIQKLDQVRDRVIADYKHSQAVQLARRAGADFAHSVTNGIAQGKTFAAISTEAKVKPFPVPPMSRATKSLPAVEEHVGLYEFKSIAFTTPVGKASDFNETDDGGLVVYVQQRLPLDDAKLRADLPEYLKRVRMARRQEAVNAWFQKEFSRSVRGVQRTPQGAGPSTAGS